jgi:hypothetical protein
MMTEFSNLGAYRAALPDLAAHADFTAMVRYLANLKNVPLTPQVKTAAK